MARRCSTTSRSLGAAAIVAALVGYALLGGLIQGAQIPAIVVTLGASFIWAGIGYSLQPTPGGTSPDWLTALTGWSISPYVPTSILLIATVALIGLCHRSLCRWASFCGALEQPGRDGRFGLAADPVCDGPLFDRRRFSPPPPACR